MLQEEKAKMHPFGNNEKRFIGSKLSNGNDIKDYKFKTIQNSRRDNLEGGIGKFVNVQDDSYLERASRKKNFAHENSRNKIPTERVINPSIEQTSEPRRAKKACHSVENSRHLTDGTFQSLLNRTPEKFISRGKKIITAYNVREKETNMFSKEFLFDKTVTGLFGVMRKVRKKRSDEKESKEKSEVRKGRRMISQGKLMNTISYF